MNSTPVLSPVCCACGEKTDSDQTFGSMHRACVERLLTRQRRDTVVVSVGRKSLLELFGPLGRRLLAAQAARDLADLETIRENHR